jgi:hypothetical protein
MVTGRAGHIRRVLVRVLEDAGHGLTPRLLERDFTRPARLSEVTRSGLPDASLRRRGSARAAASA